MGASPLASPVISLQRFGCICGSKLYRVSIQIKQGAFGGFASRLKENLKPTQTGALLGQEGEG